MKHKIKLEDFKDFTITYQVAGSYGKGSHKTLNSIISVICSNFEYEVLENTKLVLKTFSLTEALEKFNELD